MTLSGSHGGVGDLDRWFGQRGGDRQPLGCTVKFFGIVNVGRRRWDHIGMLGAEERRIVRREAESGLHGQREREKYEFDFCFSFSFCEMGIEGFSLARM